MIELERLNYFNRIQIFLFLKLIVEIPEFKGAIDLCFDDLNVSQMESAFANQIKEESKRNELKQADDCNIMRLARINYTNGKIYFEN